MTAPSDPTREDRVSENEYPMPRSLVVGAQFGWRILVLIALLVVGLWLVDYFRLLVIPLLVAVLLAALLRPLVNLAMEQRVPRGLAVAGAMLVAIGVVSGLITLVGTQLANGFSDLTTGAAAGIEEIEVWLTSGPLHMSNADVNQYIEQAREQITDALTANQNELAGQALDITATAGEVFTGAALALFTLIFLLLEGERIWSWVVRLFPREAHLSLDLAGRAGWRTLTSYVRATIVVATADALGIGIGAALLGVPFAVPIGVLVFLGAFVPIVGALISGSVAVLVALVALGPWQALIMLAIVIGVQQMESHVLQPFVLGRAVQIHPLGVVLAIGAGLLVAGIPGALFSVPLVAFLNTTIHALHGREDPMVTDPVSADPRDRVELDKRPDSGAQ